MKKSLFRFNSNNKQKKFFKASLVFFISLFIGFVVYSVTKYIINIDKTATIEVLVAPSDATLIIDNREFPTKATIKIKPGIYSVEIKKDGFVNYTGEINAIANQTVYLYEYLKDKDGNTNVSDENSEDALRIQQINDTTDELYYKAFVGDDPIWNITPINDYSSGYRISAEKNEENKTVINIFLYTCSKDRTEKLKQGALEYLKENKIDLNNYIIKYSNCS